MRIKKLPMAGIALVLVGAGAKSALAGDVTISTATTTPLSTSAPDGNSPGNITVQAAGSIAVQANQAAITVDSNNTVNNQGAISSNDADGTRGIVLGNGVTGALTNSGSISLLESGGPADTDSDGDLDGLWATGTNRIGIFLGPGAAFTGNVTHSAGSIAIEGQHSSDIRLDGQLIGNLQIDGALGIIGDNSQALAINGGATAGVNGDVIVRGALNVRGQNSVGILVDAPITGAFKVRSSADVSGFHSVVHPTSDTVIAALDPDDLLLSGSAVAVHYSIGGGMVIEGIGAENDVDDDGDGITEAQGDTNDNLTADIKAYTNAPAVWIAPNASDPQTLTLGALANGFGLWNRGGVSANGVYNGFSATAIRIEGVGGAGVNTAGGVENDGVVSAVSFEAAATGIYIGADVTAPLIGNRRTVTAQSVSEADFDATVLQIAPGAHAGTVFNAGALNAQLLGELGDAIVIRDLSNSVSLVENTGTIQAQVIATDSDLTDNITPVATGSAIAFDASTSTIDVTYRQKADVPFTDDDTVDDDVNNRPAIITIGDVRFGSGADHLDLLAGSMFSNVSFGAGADVLTIDNGAILSGRLSDSDGALTINVIHGSLGVVGSHVNITSATFGAQSELAVLLDPVAANSTLITASGAVSFAPGAKITPVIPAGLPDSGTQTFLTALGGLTGANNVTRVVTGVGAPFIYNLSIDVAQGDPNSLAASFLLKTPTELGLNANQAAAYAPIIEAVRRDNAASSALAGLTDQLSFQDAYADLLPDYSSAAAELATTAIQQTAGATSTRIEATRLRDARQISVWAQEIGYGVNRDPKDFGVEYRGYGFGFAGGIDGPLRNGALFGLSGSFISSQEEEPGRRSGQISTSFGQANAYLGTSLGPIDIDLVGGAGIGKMSSKRVVAIGSSFTATAEADWWAYEGHAAIRASAPQRMGFLTLTPYVGLTYVNLNEQAYTETGGGDAIDLDVDGTMSQRLWADAGLKLGARWRTRGGSELSPHIDIGYRANAIDKAADRTLRFVSGGSDFTLVDETNGAGAPLVGLGLDTTNGYSTFSIQYEGEFGDQLTRHSLNAALRFRF